MKRHLPFWAAVVSLVASCNTHQSYETDRVNKDRVFTVTGNIKGLDSGYVYFLNYQFLDSAPDSAKITHGQFSFTGKADTPTYYLLGIMNFGRMEYRMGFFAENMPVTISGRKDIPNGIKASGGPVEEEHNLYLAGRKRIEDERHLLTISHDSLYYFHNFKGADSVAELLEGVEKKLKAQVKDFAEQHPSSLASAFEIYQEYIYDPDVDELAPMYNGLHENIRASYFGRELAELLDFAKKTAPGNLAPEFSQVDANGNEIELSSYRQKYVLIDFWASWCGPCRVDHPNLVRVHQKYKSKGFDILSVSLDDKKDRWVKAIKIDHLTWNQVSDLKGWKNSAALLYGIKSIPMNFLLDKEGKIVAKGLRSEELDKKLEEILK